MANKYTLKEKFTLKFFCQPPNGREKEKNMVNKYITIQCAKVYKHKFYGENEKLIKEVSVIPAKVWHK